MKPLEFKLKPSDGPFTVVALEAESGSTLAVANKEYIVAVIPIEAKPETGATHGPLDACDAQLLAGSWAMLQALRKIVTGGPQFGVVLARKCLKGIGDL